MNCLLRNRLPQLGDPLEAVQRGLVELVVVERVVRVPVRLRAVHRRVGLLEELGAAAAERDADARSHQQVSPRDLDRGGDLLEQALRDDGRLRGFVDRRQEHGKLVTAEPRHRVAGPDHGLRVFTFIPNAITAYAAC